MTSPNVLNPDSVVLNQLDGHWQKIATLIVWKLAGANTPVSISMEDMKQLEKEFAPDGPALFTHGKHDAFEFSVVSMRKAQELAEYDRKQRAASTSGPLN